ncbi:beta-glucosidase [Terracoccus luteus]|uniref:beta-glucosidase n=1 Tax=Terracoccus luteus TaxID=53356 RepID=A0A495XYP9_9MICO|nr:glycoside hydrolase family 3 N-terminal domain-containing protein [Terracoccus luteus]RKT79731.1 beta-glucosidase [Terracoccus luteus]
MPATDPTARPWLDAALPVDTRVELLLAVMTTAEKVGQLHQVANLDADDPDDVATLVAGGVGSSLYASGATAGNERDPGVRREAVEAAQRVALERSRLGIPVLVARDVVHGHRTVFPIPLGLAASFDDGLVERAAAVAAGEAAADGVRWTFAPMVDLSEDPRWGRVAESFGESPVLSGRLGAAFVRGLQGPSADDLADAGRLAGCAKHFVGYGLAAGGRDYDTVSVGENTLRNLHLRPFRAAVDAGVATVMAGFNDVDGTPMHAHPRLLRDVLRGEWGFDGVVVADWLGVAQLVDQGVAADAREAAALAITSGVDVDMVSGAYAAHLESLVDDGTVATEVLDASVRRVLRLKLRLGLFERPYAATSSPYPATSEPTDATRAVALEAARAAHVVVKNDGVLPLRADATSYLLTGPFVEEGEALLGTWTLDGRGDDVVTPSAAFRHRLGIADDATGERLWVDDGRFADRVQQRARRCDVTVALVGEHPWRSGEANSVTDLGLPPGQLDVLRALAAVGRPLVVVVYTGRPLDLGAVLELADAVTVVWHPGLEAGNALASVLFGDVEPSGRLPVTFPRSVGHVPTSTHQRPTGRPIPAAHDRREGRYLDDLTGPRLPFGFGLSYTSVTYAAPTVSAATAPLGGSVSVRVEVRNTGDRPAPELVQLWLRDPVAQVTRPVAELLDWRRVTLPPGGSRVVEFDVGTDAFTYAGRDGTARVDRGEVVLLTGPHAGDLTPVTVTVV